ncbi:MAG: hypothetical protein AB1776_08995 [Bacillota bacterium]
MHALHVLLTDLAAELGYGPGTAGSDAGSTLMDRVGKSSPTAPLEAHERDA